MALFKYTGTDKDGKERVGMIDAVSRDVAISALQRRGLIVTSVVSSEKKSLFDKDLGFFSKVKQKEIVLLSQEIMTLFEAQVSALRAFRLLAAESDNPALQKVLTEIANDLQSGSNISDALAKHPKIFSKFYINMVRSGEETGRLDETFAFLAEYIDKSYTVTTKARNALIYPAFVIVTFIAVMVLMLTTVIPKLSAILEESGNKIPTYTKFVIGLSNFLSNYILLILVGIVLGGVFLYRYATTQEGKQYMARARLNIPYVGDLYRKLYMSRLADSLSTTLKSGISFVRGIEIAGTVIGDPVYEQILKKVAEDVKTGHSIEDAFSKHPEFPGILVAMIKVGDETGDLSSILSTIAKFYRREVDNAISTLISLIEPLMIVMLGLGVGLLLASVLVPIYNISAGV